MGVESQQRDICPDIIFCDSKTGKNLIHLNDFGCTGQHGVHIPNQAGQCREQAVAYITNY